MTALLPRVGPAASWRVTNSNVQGSATVRSAVISCSSISGDEHRSQGAAASPGEAGWPITSTTESSASTAYRESATCRGNSWPPRSVQAVAAAGSQYLPGGTSTVIGDDVGLVPDQLAARIRPDRPCCLRRITA